MNKTLVAAILVLALLVFSPVCIFTDVCKADANDVYRTLFANVVYHDTVISFLSKGIESLDEQIESLESSLTDVRKELADTRVELAEMRGEMRGRQNVTTGVAAGTPTGLAGLLVWWMRRERRKK